MTRFKLSSRYALAALALGVFGLLSGCDKDKDIEPPAELVDFKSSLEVDRVWSVSIGGGDPVMRAGLAPAVDGEVVYAAGRDGDVLAISQANGKTLWRARTRAELTGGPGAGFGIVAVGSANGELIALDQATGTTLWTVPVGGEVLSAPAIAPDAVVVRTVAGVLLGLSRDDGKVLWREEQQIPRLTLRGAAAPVVAGNAAICGFDNGRVISAETRNGEVLWEQLVSAPRGRTELERLVDIDAAVKVSGVDVFVAGFQGRVAMLALDSGQSWWSREISSHRGLDVDDESVYVSTATGEVIALRRRSGVEVWRQDGLRLRGLSAPVAIGAYVAVADFEGYVHWLNAGTGAFVARTKAGTRVSNPPVRAGDLIVLQDDEGRVTAFRPRG
jgi:outer membrane protein assembly factor BamB